MKPYGIISDTHNHLWSSFATVNSDGVNSRLRIILNETVRCAEAVGAAGGKTIFHAGDLFHVRGSIAPSVLNPTKDVYRKLIEMGFEIVILAGNHDLEGKDAERVSSAITALEDIGCIVANSVESVLESAGRVVLIPWMKDIESLKKAIQDAAKADPKPSEVDLIIHAPIDGVISGLPDHGLTAEWLSKRGFRRVFAGHYHNHKDFGNGVYSIGACAHHTWGDIGSKAGFLVVSDKEVKWHSTRAPRFIEINGDTGPDDIPLVVDGNYVRVRMDTSKQSDVEEMREQLMAWGAKAVTMVVNKEATVTARTGATVKAGASISESIQEFIKAKGFDSPADLGALCDKILRTAQAETLEE